MPHAYFSLVEQGCSGARGSELARRPTLRWVQQERLTDLSPRLVLPHLTVWVISGGTLEVVVPAAQYRDVLDPDEQRGYDELLAKAKHVERLPFAESTEQAHLAGGQAVVDGCERLVAVWDGQPARGIGGTADVVSYARQKGVPVAVLWPEGATRE